MNDNKYIFFLSCFREILVNALTETEPTYTDIYIYKATFGRSFIL